MKNQDKFMNIIELTSLIKKYSKKLEKGSINLSELTSFLEVSRELNERIIILRYKLMEQSTVYANVKTVGEMNSMIERKNNEINEEFISKDQTNLFDAINQQEINENGYEVNKSNSHLSFSKLLFEDGSDIENNQSLKSDKIDEEISFDIDEASCDNDEVVEISEPSLKKEENVEEQINDSSIIVNEDTIEEKSLNESLNKLTDDKEALVDELKKNAIDDLESSISLNQKFIFINDLFNGESMVYNEIISQLNTQENLKRALEILRATGTEYEWPVDGNPALNTLYELVERRYKTN